MKTKVLGTGEKVILDPEATTERVMLWFYLLINIGGFMQVATSYAEKYVGFWLGFILPLFLYLPLPLLLVRPLPYPPTIASEDCIQYSSRAVINPAAVVAS